MISPDGPKDVSCLMPFPNLLPSPAAMMTRDVFLLLVSTLHLRIVSEYYTLSSPKGRPLLLQLLLQHLSVPVPVFIRLDCFQGNHQTLLSQRAQK